MMASRTTRAAAAAATKVVGGRRPSSRRYGPGRSRCVAIVPRASLTAAYRYVGQSHRGAAGPAGNRVIGESHPFGREVAFIVNRPARTHSTAVAVHRYTYSKIVTIDLA